MSTSPRRTGRWLRIALFVCALASAPFPFVGLPTRWFLGLPLWLWWSIGCTTLLSLLTAWTIHRHWDDG